eukprot:scaffold6979_cov27-Tisochrysis_lutea.AAC.1
MGSSRARRSSKLRSLARTDGATLPPWDASIQAAEYISTPRGARGSEFVMGTRRASIRASRALLAGAAAHSLSMSFVE